MSTSSKDPIETFRPLSEQEKRFLESSERVGHKELSPATGKGGSIDRGRNSRKPSRSFIRVCLKSPFFYGSLILLLNLFALAFLLFYAPYFNNLQMVSEQLQAVQVGTGSGSLPTEPLETGRGLMESLSWIYSNLILLFALFSLPSLVLFLIGFYGLKERAEARKVQERDLSSEELEIYRHLQEEFEKLKKG